MTKMTKSITHVNLPPPSTFSSRNSLTVRISHCILYIHCCYNEIIQGKAYPSIIFTMLYDDIQKKNRSTQKI